MFIHKEKIEPCKCGSKKKPHIDSDDFVPCWMVECFDCGQTQHGADWSMEGAIKEWNSKNEKS